MAASSTDNLQQVELQQSIGMSMHRMQMQEKEADEEAEAQAKARQASDLANEAFELERVEKLTVRSGSKCLFLVDGALHVLEQPRTPARSL